ncbi:hypothetical protein BJX62DRAFT_244907 [Aspergillus germanicus]
MPIFDIVDVSQNLLQMPSNLPARRYALLLAIKAAAHAHSSLLRDYGDEYDHQILAEAIQASKKYDVVEEEDNYSLEGLLGSFFLFIACWNLDRETSAWWYLRQSIGLALARRLNQEAEYLKFTVQEGERKKRIFWTLLIAERTFCLMHDRPVVLQADIILPGSPGRANGEVAALVCSATLFQRLLFDSSGCWTASGFVIPVTFEEYGNDTTLSLSSQSVGRLPVIQRIDYLVTMNWLRAKVWELGSVQARLPSGLISSSENAPWRLEQPLAIGSHVVEILQSSVDVLALALTPVLDWKLHAICACVFDILPTMQRIRPGVCEAVLRCLWDLLCKVNLGGRTADFLFDRLKA